MSVLKNFKNIPGRPAIGRQALSVIFFQICNEVPGQKKNERGACRPPTGDMGLAHPRGDRVPPPYISPGRHSLVI